MEDDHFSRRSSVLKGDLPEDFASMETERILMYQREDTEDYGNIDTDRTVQGFKASLRVLLADERLRHRKSFSQSGFLGKEGGLGRSANIERVNLAKWGEIGLKCFKVVAGKQKLLISVRLL